jgi:hypothetical protein
MRQCKPVQQVAGGFVRRRAVKGHHGGRHAWASAKLRPPPVADAGHFHLVRAPADDVFKMMNVHVCDVCWLELRARTILFGKAVQSSEATREGAVHRWPGDGLLGWHRKKKFVVRFSTAFARIVHRISTLLGGYNTSSPFMSLRLAALIVFVSLVAATAAHAAADATLFRVFLRDGASLVSFGEFARVDDQVVFSMPVGGPADEPRLHVVSVPTAEVDWPRTERYSAAVRAQRYADTRGEEDFERLSNDIARVLNEVALSPDKNAALSSAEHARETLANWPAAHYGYRERDVREVVSLLDEAISDLRASAGRNDFSLALVAQPAETGYEPILGPPSIVEQIDATFRAARVATHVADRVSLLQESLALVAEAGAALSPSEAARLRRLAEDEIHEEAVVDERYATVTRRLLASATNAAGQARISDVERIINRVAKEDAQLGRRRPEVVQALDASLRLQLDNARQLRLLRDRWQIRRSTYRQYQHTINSQLLQLVKIQPSLDAIRRLTGPSPTTLVTLRSRLAGGADRLQRMAVPDFLRETHELLVSAWRFAETAVDIRYDAVSSGNVAVALQASSSAAGALLMVDRVQREIRALLEPPRLQ